MYVYCNALIIWAAIGAEKKPRTYAGTVMTSLIMLPNQHVVTCSNQANQSMNRRDRTGDTVSSVGVTNEKDMALQRQM